MLPFCLGGGDRDSTIVVSQFRQVNRSKSLRFSRDLEACMAMPQTGQWRIGVGGPDIMGKIQRISPSDI